MQHMVNSAGAAETETPPNMQGSELLHTVSVTRLPTTLSHSNMAPALRCALRGNRLFWRIHFWWSLLVLNLFSAALKRSYIHAQVGTNQIIRHLAAETAAAGASDA